MKKLFAVLMVLCLCGAVSASMISLELEGTQIIAAPGDDVIINIATDTPLYGLDAVVTVTNGDIINKAMNPIDDPGNPNAYGWDMVGYPITPIGVPGPVVEVGGTTFTGESNLICGYVVVAFTGTGPQVVSVAAGVKHGGSFDNEYNTPDFSTGIVEIIPEPMTIALLGLGGLFLLRRRK